MKWRKKMKNLIMDKPIEKGIIEKTFRFFSASGIFKVLCPFFYYIFNKKRHIKVVEIEKSGWEPHIYRFNNSTCLWNR
jgi:hypothetical protein